MVKTEKQKSLFHWLKILNICSRCKLRYLGVRSYKSFLCNDDINKILCQFEGSKTDTDESSSDEFCFHLHKRLHLLPCALCIGVLQDECDKVAEKIASVVAENGHQFHDFIIQLSLPATIDLRQSVMISFLNEKIGGDLSEKDVVSVKEVWKWIVGSNLSKILNVEFSPDSDFQITVSLTYYNIVEDCRKLLSARPEAFPNRYRNKLSKEKLFNRTSVLKAIGMLSTQLKDWYLFPLTPPDKSCDYEPIICTFSPLYIAGRYNKYSRELSQTPWIVDGERRMESSVQELITDVVLKRIKCDSIVFSASGREDVDVKMLGNGRPFVLEVINPRKVNLTRGEMKSIENEINGSTTNISVNRLQIVPKGDLKLLKEGEEFKKKVYTAQCITKKILTEKDLKLLASVTDLTIKQKTPIRVLHRRPLATRNKIIHSLSGTIVDDHTISIQIKTQAGTYVKEFIHGDFGRTQPNLGSLLNTEADIFELDVDSIELDWPPEVPQPSLEESQSSSELINAEQK